MTSLHTFLHTQYALLLGGGLCLTPSVLDHKQCVCVACAMLRASRAVNAADLTACQLLFNTSRLTYSLIPPPC